MGEHDPEEHWDFACVRCASGLQLELPLLTSFEQIWPLASFGLQDQLVWQQYEPLEHTESCRHGFSEGARFERRKEECLPGIHAVEGVICSRQRRRANTRR